RRGGHGVAGVPLWALRPLPRGGGPRAQRSAARRVGARRAGGMGRRGRNLPLAAYPVRGPPPVPPRSLHAARPQVLRRRSLRAGVPQGRGAGGSARRRLRPLRRGRPRERRRVADRPAGVGPAVPADRTRGKLPPAHLPRPGGHRPGEVGAVSVVLSLILWVPVAGAVALLFVGPERVGTIRRVALAASLLAFAASLAAALAFDRAHAGVMQFVEVRPWIPSIGVTYHLGVDGLSLPLVLLTTLLTVLCVIYSWRVDVRPKEYMILFLLLETGMVGVFLAL